LGTPFNLLIRRMDTHPLIIPHPWTWHKWTE
jgi:hypothetical protein